MNRKQIKFCIINTLGALLLFFVLQKSHILPGENSKLFFLGPLVKNMSISETPESYKKEFLIINTSYDRMLVPHYENVLGEADFKGLQRGNIDILDREKLARFFKRIKIFQNYRYIICNVLFDQPSEYDNDLLSSISNTQNIVVAQGEDINRLLPEFRALNLGLDAIYTPGGSFSKYRLFEKSGDRLLKSMPLKMYEALYDKKIDDGFFFSRLNGSLIFNDFTPEYEVKNDAVIRPIDLGDILLFDDAHLAELTKGKIIIIGDYYNNLKKTVYDPKTPSHLILLNAFLALEKGYPKISFGLVASLLLIFLFFSFLIITKQSKVESRIFKFPLLGGLVGGASYVLAMSFFSILINAIFGSNFNLVYMGVFFYLENIVVNRHFHYLRIKRRLNIGPRSGRKRKPTT
ncbi:CHASE2 domain-containing protein [uncultured Kriegella sp.]|uniref:CHASE2 domain-containing protein n=1 Tax=uncultured Kriegella sp. TaxID=1798910 RepID=UPI0030D7B51F|tara:strand:+ start:54651 stop:55862 length:1212 start_codon:yes stop_codon:yes gene_type:complete